MRPERTWARPEVDEMEFIYKSGQERGTWTHSTGDPPETDKQGEGKETDVDHGPTKQTYQPGTSVQTS